MWLILDRDNMMTGRGLGREMAVKEIGLHKDGCSVDVSSGHTM